MVPIETYVFFDTEATGVPTREHGIPAVTELCILAVKRRHFLESRADEELRVQYKLLMCFKPYKKMSDKSVELSGLNQELLKQEARKHFNLDVFNTINSFINCLQKPVCLIAHNGFRNHFPILKYYFTNMGQGVQLSPEVKCTDSLLAFYDLLEAEKLGSMSDMSENLSTTQEKSFLQLYRNPFFAPNAVPEDSYVLNNIYRRVVNGAHLETNRAENQCVMMLKIASGRAERFVQWVDANHCPFSQVPNEPALQK